MSIYDEYMKQILGRWFSCQVLFYFLGHNTEHHEDLSYRI
jgi:hypothetical protein